jgi:hypothetical protein
MFTEKEKTFDWLVPKTGINGRVISEDFRVNTKHNAIYLGYRFMQKFYKGTDLNDVRVAFIGLTNSDNPFLVVNPNQGIPYFKFKTSKGNKNPSPSISSKFLSELFKCKFNIKSDQIISFELEPFQRFNGMMFYSIKHKYIDHI